MLTMSYEWGRIKSKEGDFLNNSFSRYIIGDQILFKHAKGTGAIKGREFHEYHEILLFIDGELEFFSDGIRAEIKKNQLIIIPKQQYHQFHIKGNENNYHRCVFNFYNLPKFSTLINKCMNRLYITDASNEVKLLFNRAIAISEANLEEEEKKELLRSILLLVINELSTKGQNEELGEQYFENTLCMRCIEYINAQV